MLGGGVIKSSPILFLMAAAHVHAVTLYQADTFDSSLSGWGGGSTLTWVNGGGPGGASDGFMQITSGGGGGNGSRWVVYNRVQWSGDYLSTLGDRITMDVINMGATNLNLRIVLGNSDAPDDNSGEWFASAPIMITPGSGWQSVTFSLQDNLFIPAQGMGDIDEVLGGAVTLRILSAVSAAPKGDVLVAQGGIDNIRIVPEPSAGVLVLLACVGFFKRRR
jgi:hypothetical protein